MTLKSRFYDLVASKFYDKHLNSDAMNEVRMRAVNALGLWPGAQVLEVGCGTGLNQPFLAEAVGEEGTIIAVDASKEMLRRAEERAREGEYSERIAFIEGDVREIEWLTANARDDEGVDAVLFSLILTVVPEWESVFEKAFSLLAPGGSCVIMDTYWPNPNLFQRAMCLAYAADPTRPTFEPMQSFGAEFQIEFYPPDEKTFFLASARAPANMMEAELTQIASNQNQEPDGEEELADQAIGGT